MHQELQFARKLPGKFNRVAPPVLNDIQKHQIEGTLSKLELITEKVQISKRCIKIALLLWVLVFVLFMMNGYRKYSMRVESYGEDVGDPRGRALSSDPQSFGHGRLLQARPNPPNPENKRKDPPTPPRGPRDQTDGPRAMPPVWTPPGKDSRPTQKPPKAQDSNGEVGRPQPVGEDPLEGLEDPQAALYRPGRIIKRLSIWCWVLFPFFVYLLVKRSKRTALQMSCKLLEIENRYMIPYSKIKYEMKELEVLLVTVINDYTIHHAYPSQAGFQGENMPLRVELPTLSDPNNTSFDI